MGRNVDVRVWLATFTHLVVFAMRFRSLILLLDVSLLTLCQIFVGRPRFSELDTYEVIMAVVGDRRPPRPSGLHKGLWNIIQQCWQMVSTHRPMARDIVKKFSSQSSARRREAPACDWDEVPMSRIRSTLGGKPLVTATFSGKDTGGSLFLLPI
jgi:hypothetical protein